jgi:muramoyltetrapeptide carboxypeptidase
MRALVRPPAIPESATVAVVATSSPISAAELERLVGYFHHRGNDVRVYESARTATGYLAGPAEQRAADLMDAFTDPDVRLIVPATGGKGAAGLLPLLDYDAIAAHPKVFTGMSDPSALGNALLARAGLVTLHGPSGYDFFQPNVHEATAAAFWQAVSGPIDGHVVKGDEWRVARGGPGFISGHVVGGHLGTIRALVGTPYMPDLNGAVLLLEEVFVPWVNVDAALTHLRQAGVFDQVAAVMFGVPLDCDRGDAPDNSWDDMILRGTGGTVPVITNVEFGHTSHKIPFPLGGKVELELSNVPLLRYRDNLVGDR